MQQVLMQIHTSFSWCGYATVADCTASQTAPLQRGTAHPSTPWPALLHPGLPCRDLPCLVQPRPAWPSPLLLLLPALLLALPLPAYLHPCSLFVQLLPAALQLLEALHLVNQLLQQGNTRTARQGQSSRVNGRACPGLLWLSRRHGAAYSAGQSAASGGSLA